MEMRSKLVLLAFAITLFVFVTFVTINSTMDTKREEIVESGMQGVINQVNELQTLLLLGDVYGANMTCIIMNEKLKQLDQSVWKLGLKIDDYRQATEEFYQSPYYKEQKKVFNEQEVLYLSLLKTAKQKCGIMTPTVLFFYQNGEDCDKCDDQSFVLGDINRKADAEIAIFSFDMDLNLTTLRLLHEFYQIDQYPCVVVEDQKACGMQDKSTIIEDICKAQEISLCGN